MTEHIDKINDMNVALQSEFDQVGPEDAAIDPATDPGVNGQANLSSEVPGVSDPDQTNGKKAAWEKALAFCKKVNKEYIVALAVFLILLIILLWTKPAFVRKPGTSCFSAGMAFAIALVAALLVIVIGVIYRSIQKKKLKSTP